MSLLQNSNAIPVTASADFYDHQIAKSFKWDSGYLKWTPGSAGNRQVWTFSCWVKKAIQPGNTDVMLLNAGTSGNQDTRFRAYWYGDNLRSSSANANYNVSSGVYRDPSAWMHIVWKLTGGTSTQYVNGTSVSTSSVSGDVAINNNVEHTLGIAGDYGTSGRFKGCIAEVVFIDGTAHDPDDFAETKNGVWIPKDPSGLTFGSQGYYLDFADASAPGNDVSGNNNDWTNVNLATHDQMLDSPTFGSEGSANFPIINVLDPTITTSAISEGNLKITEGNNLGGKATFAVPLTGKWYWEAYCYADTGQEMWNGITGITANSSGDGRGGSSNSNTYGASWSQYSGSNYYIRKYIAGTESAVSGSFGTTKHTILGIAVNRDDNEIKFYKDNALQITNAISATQEYFPAGGMGGGTNATTIQVWNFGQDGTFAGEKTAQGNADGNGYGNFYYSPPSGHLALNSANLPNPAADPAEDEGPSNYAQALIYTGDANNTRSLTTSLNPDSAWFKNRTTAASTPTRWYNTIKQKYGTTNEYVQFDMASYGAASSTYKGVTASSSSSITIGNVGYINVNSSSYVGYFLGTGASTTTDTSGDIDVERYTNADIGISIMYYTGSGTSGNEIPHGLGVKPELVIVKNSTSSNSSAWRAWFDKNSYDYNDYFVVNTDAAVSTSSGIFSGNPTTTMLPMANGTTENASSNTYMMWAFASKEGFCKVGSYVGNANANGTFVYLGFSPEFIIFKPIVAGSWRIKDIARNPYNPTDKSLYVNTNDPEESYAGDNIDFLSNGFKMRSGDSQFNQATTFLYVAFAHNPFKYATSR